MERKLLKCQKAPVAILINSIHLNHFRTSAIQIYFRTRKVIIKIGSFELHVSDDSGMVSFSIDEQTILRKERAQLGCSAAEKQWNFYFGRGYDTKNHLI